MKSWSSVVVIFSFLGVVSIVGLLQYYDPPSRLRRRLQAENKPNPPVVIDSDPGAPQLAWLMSFPDSGTTFTSMTIQSVSQRGTASNYGNMFLNPENSREVLRDVYESIPVYSNRPDGPWLFSNLPLPPKYILTKTHCGGHCTDCFPGRYIMGPNQFVRQCHTSNYFDPNSEEKIKQFRYDQNLIKKAVHIIRNPFDNVVSRFHHEYKLAVIRKDDDWSDKYYYNTQGFHKWCDFQAVKYREEEFKWFPQWSGRHDIMEIAKGVPCYAEFFKYIRWHNNAFYTTDEVLKVPTKILHYENWATDFEGTLDKVLTFYELPKEAKPPMSFHHHTYEYYTDQEKKATIDFMRVLANATLWENLRPYVGDHH